MNITMRSGDFVPAEVPQKKPLQLEYGKHYRTRSGKVVGPLTKTPEMHPYHGTHPFWIADKWFTWQPDGRYAPIDGPREWKLDLMEEVVVEETATNVKKPFNPHPWNQGPIKELQDARSRIVELEAESRMALEQRKLLEVHNNELRSLLDSMERSRNDWKARHDAIHWQASNKIEELESVTTLSANRVTELEAECGRLHKLWHGAEENAAGLLADKAALERSRDTWKAAIAPYGNLVTNLAATLGMDTMEISLDEILVNVKGMVEARNQALGWAQQWETACREKAAELEKLRNERPSVVLLQRVQEAVMESDNWANIAKLEAGNAAFYRDLLGQCAKLLGDECRRCDDGRLIPADDFLALKVPEVLEKELRAGADIARENDELHRKCIAAKNTLESVTHLVSAHISLGHELFGGNGTFGGALVLGQDVVLDGMKWMRNEILRLRSIVATELGKATDNILKEL